MNRPAAAAARDAVFVSYSHDDQDWRRKFTQILAPLVRNRRLELWDDTHIPVGDDWRRNIDDGVRRAGAALLLVTGSYLASRFIMEEELPALVAHGVRLVPVLVEDCLWDQEPLLAAVQWAHDPGRDGPLAAADPREVNGRIVRACRKLLEIAPAAGQPPRAAGPVSAGVPPDGVMALPQGPAGPLHGVPALPANTWNVPSWAACARRCSGPDRGGRGDRGGARPGPAWAGRDRQDGAGGRGRP